MTVAHWILIFAAAYFAAGVPFAGVFLVRGVGRIDPAARGTGLGFRCLIAPGVVALWPILAWKWRRAVRAESGPAS